jgi:hypothetical protein
MPSDNILISIAKGLADVRRMLANIHADLQVLKRDFHEFKELAGC